MLQTNQPLLQFLANLVKDEQRSRLLLLSVIETQRQMLRSANEGRQINSEHYQTGFEDLLNLIELMYLPK